MFRSYPGLPGSTTDVVLSSPVANTDSMFSAIASGSNVTLDIVANDIYTGTKSALTVNLTTAALTDGAAAVVDANNNVTFTPSASASTQEFSYTITDSIGTSNSATVTVTVEAASVGAGVNEITNSKWTGGTDFVPQNWTGTGLVAVGGVVEKATADAASHSALQFTTTGSTGSVARIGQDINVVEGNVYWISIYCTDVVAADSSPDNPAINWFPFSALTLIDGSTRPLVSDLVAGNQYACKVQATVTGTVGLRFGTTEVSTDITLERPMMDDVTGVSGEPLRAYVATDPITPTLDLDDIQYAGQYLGHVGGYRSNNSAPLDSNRQAKIYIARRSGTIQAIQFMMTSNQNDGEVTKSSIAGSSSRDEPSSSHVPHSYPAEWDQRTSIHRATLSGSTLTINATPVWEYDWTYRSEDGSSAYNRCHVEFNNTDHGLSFSVTEGEVIAVVQRNMEASPRDNWCTFLNGSAVYTEVNWAGIGSGLANGAYWGDSLTAFQGSGSTGTTFTPRSRGPLNQLVVRYSDGVEDGCLDVDSTFDPLRGRVGGAYRIKQDLTITGYYARASGVILYGWKTASTSEPLTVTITGSGLSTVTLNIPASSFPSAGDTLVATTANFSSPVTLAPGIAYTITLSAPSAATGIYSFGCIRKENVVGLGDQPPSAPPQKAPSTPTGGIVRIDRHAWPGGTGASESFDGGDTYGNLGWPSGNANMPFAFIVGGNVAATLGGLT